MISLRESRLFHEGDCYGLFERGGAAGVRGVRWWGKTFTSTHVRLCAVDAANVSPVIGGAPPAATRAGRVTINEKRNSSVVSVMNIWMKSKKFPYHLYLKAMVALINQLPLVLIDPFHTTEEI